MKVYRLTLKRGCHKGANPRRCPWMPWHSPYMSAHNHTSQPYTSSGGHRGQIPTSGIHTWPQERKSARPVRGIWSLSPSVIRALLASRRQACVGRFPYMARRTSSVTNNTKHAPCQIPTRSTFTTTHAQIPNKKRITPLPILSLNFKTQNIPKIYPLSWGKKKRRRRDMRHLGSRRRKTKQKRSSELISLGVECLRPGGAVVSPFAAPPVRLPASKSVLRSLWRTEHPAKTQENDEMRESARPGSDRGDRCGGESN